MTFLGKRGLGLLLAGVLLVSMPMGVFASEGGEEPAQTSVTDMESEGYYIKLSDDNEYTYTGKAVEPEFQIMYKDNENTEKEADLEKGIDYTVKYENNIEISSQSDKKPAIIVKGIETDGNGYKGTLKQQFEIVESKTTNEGPETVDQVLSISECTVSLSAASFICDGTAKKPEVTVKQSETVLIQGTDYTLEYKNNTNVGTASVTITGIGKYTGSREENYTIGLGSTTLSSTSSYSKITLRWNKVPGAAGYQIYKGTSKSSLKAVTTVPSGATVSYGDKGTKFNSTYYYKIRAYCSVNGKTVYGSWSSVRAQKKKLGAPTITAAKGAANSIKITWKKVGGANGYVLYRSTSEKGKYKKIATIKKASTVSYTNKNLSSGKTYYYKVKAYRKVKKKNCYGYTSAAAAASTKKLEGGWRYVNGYKLFYDKNGKLVKDVSSIIGKQSSYVIKVNKKKNCVTVYARDGKNGYIIPVKAFPCSAGHATPITTARTPAKYRWHALNGNCYGQWCTRIKQGYLFHSVMYGKTKNTTLSVSNYNKLGTTASHGCIRLRAGDAKWIYDNCKLKTKVIIYNGSSAGPLGKPKASKLPKWHKWDPTDPTARYKCKQKGCH